MQNQQAIPRRTMRNRPYDLRKRVLLKNFLRAQNANQNFSVFNTLHLNSAPTVTEENGNSEANENEPDGEVFSENSTKDSCEGTDRSQEYSGANDSQNSCGKLESFSRSDSGQKTPSETVNCQKQANGTERNDLEAAITEQVSLGSVMDSPRFDKHSPKPCIQSKLAVRKPYTFCHRKNSRDLSKKKIKSGITKAKHGFKPPKSPSKRKFNVRTAFSQMFTRKISPREVREAPRDGKDQSESGSFFSKFFKPRARKTQPVRSHPNSTPLSDRTRSSTNTGFSANEYNLRSVSRYVQTDFSTCCHSYSFNAGDRFSCENRYCGLGANYVGTDNDRYHFKNSYGQKRRRYSDSSAFASSELISSRKYSASDIPRMHNSQYCNFQSSRVVGRSRSLSEQPSNLEPSRIQRTRSLRGQNPHVEYNFRSSYGRTEMSGPQVSSPHTYVTRGKNVFSESFFNQRSGRDAQRLPSLLPNPSREVVSSVFRSSSNRESSMKSPLL